MDFQSHHIKPINMDNAEPCSDFPFFSLPRELRDHIYSFIDSPRNDFYVSYRSIWSPTARKVIPERTFSPSLQGILSLDRTCQQAHVEISRSLERIASELTVHVRVLNREDAALFTALASQLHRLYPTLSTLRITWNISGEYTSIIELIPRHLYRLKAIELEVIDQLNTRDFFRDAYTLSWTRTNGSAVYLEKRIGALVLKDTRHVVDGPITTGVYHSAYVLRFEAEEHEDPEV
jgi:hypothetical protein